MEKFDLTLKDHYVKYLERLKKGTDFYRSEEDPHPSASLQMSDCLFYLYDDLKTQTGCAMMNIDNDPCCAIVDCRHSALLSSLRRGSYSPAVFASA